MIINASENNKYIEFDSAFIKEVERLTGLKFKKNQNSNSWYANKDGKEVRISDHFNKKNDQEKYYFDQDPIYVARKINKENPFLDFKKGDIIKHNYKKIGDVIFFNNSIDKEFVEIVKNGEIKKFDETVFANVFVFMNRFTQL